MTADWLWRWHGQLGGGDLVLDLGRTAGSCDTAPGQRAGGAGAGAEAGGGVEGGGAGGVMGRKEDKGVWECGGPGVGSPPTLELAAEVPLHIPPATRTTSPTHTHMRTHHPAQA